MEPKRKEVDGETLRYLLVQELCRELGRVRWHVQVFKNHFHYPNPIKESHSFEISCSLCDSSSLHSETRGSQRRPLTADTSPPSPQIRDAGSRLPGLHQLGPAKSPLHPACSLFQPPLQKGITRSIATDQHCKNFVSEPMR